ncbi:MULTISPECIES: TetR/AcrR family transcriptional regulator [unclassified Nonomuraea]|uniref:TetR/AcrR family transcriptional regulator n=1 Tax=unclassified Nonomuraea TaxID=2593643 RepID=UPI0033FA73C2
MTSKSKQALLDAGAEVFARHGLKGTRVREIVERAGVNERMIYDHFGSKEGLYRAVLDAQSSDMGAAWRPVLDRLTGQDPVAATRVALRAYFDLVCERPLLVPLLLHEGLGEGEIRPPIEPADLPAPLREVFERGQREGAFRADGDFELFYVTAICLLTVLPTLPGRLTALAGGTSGEQARARLRDQAVDLLLEGITGPAGAGR